jgi:hypothetical protein
VSFKIQAKIENYKHGRIFSLNFTIPFEMIPVKMVASNLELTQKKSMKACKYTFSIFEKGRDG